MALELSLKLKGEIRVGDRSQDQRVRHLHTFETRVMGQVKASVGLVRSCLCSQQAQQRGLRSL